MEDSQLALAAHPQQTAVNSQPLLVRLLAHLFSFVFHPLFIPLYVCWFLTFVHPSYFSGYGQSGKIRIILMVSLNAIFFPLVTALLLKALRFISSIVSPTQKDRILLYVSSMIFFFWTQYALREQQEISRILVSFMFGVFISSAAALMANIYFKISMHAIGMGGLAGLFVVIMRQNTMLMTWPLSIAILIAGLVCTSRFIVSDHSPRDIYGGLVVGLLCQFIGASLYL